MTPTSIANHLWQSTAFAALAGLLVLALRRHQAHTRCWIWMAASLKFLIPFSFLMVLGARIEWHSAPLAVVEAVSSAMYDVGAPFNPAVDSRAIAASPAAVPWVWILAGVWAVGCGALLARLVSRWRTVAAVVRAAKPLETGRECEVLHRACGTAGMTRRIPLRSSAAPLEPGVFGILRPVLVLPEGIADHLSDGQLEGICAHELAHARRRDNLAAAVHMLVEALFWFHPLVWWLGARMVEERERACDEDVLSLGGDSQTYAEGILRACEFSLQSPMPCFSGASGGELKSRVERIMRRRFGRGLGRGGKAVLVSAACAAIAVPVFVGVANLPVARAQTGPAGDERFEVVSIKPAPAGQRGSGIVTSDPGRLHAINVTAGDCIQAAYNIQRFQIVAKSLPAEHYEIIASAPNHPSRILDARYEAMLQAMLADRFDLRVHRETKVMPVYALEIGKGGPKLKESGEPGLSTRSTPGHVVVTGATPDDIAMYLTHHIQRPVVNVTNLKELYDFTLDWEPGDGDANVEPPDPDKPKPSEPTFKPSLFQALEQQIGLKLESRKLPVEMIVVDAISKPTEN